MLKRVPQEFNLNRRNASSLNENERLDANGRPGAGERGAQDKSEAPERADRGVRWNLKETRPEDGRDGEAAQVTPYLINEREQSLKSYSPHLLEIICNN